MNDLINRQAAIEACLRYNGVGWVWSQILDEIEKLPSVERHGEWIQKSTGGESFYTCSRCGFIAWEHEDTNYCPNCGARMDGD